MHPSPAQPVHAFFSVIAVPLRSERVKSISYCRISGDRINYERQIDALIVSPRLRATEAAYILNEGLKLPVKIMDCFQERNVGVFEGLTQADARARYPELWSQNITRRWDNGPTGGESVSRKTASRAFR
ncbi:histidine phosphatase family protein [Pseudomonas sp. RC4D1]|uniref:histidine phosphatase family protein n=1 Tax=Pseudomonas sp. RC4D1 TaxID=2834407 RepID=UPI001BCE10B6|nr:histidine phosphatase family protein [Pseudomonas sp. RC4D1]MBS7560168.1 histidine phosphatase family protein [Pseudomonas sp. RC4D1]